MATNVRELSLLPNKAIICPERNTAAKPGDAGVVVLSNNQIPEGKEYKNEMIMRGPTVLMGAAEKAAPPAAPAPEQLADGGLAEVQRIGSSSLRPGSGRK